MGKTVTKPILQNGWARAVLCIFLLMLIAYFVGLRPWFMNWGATEAEQRMPLAGDELMENAPQRFTRAITINASASEVWDWIVQMGQDRGGFYSNTWLENLTGANIHNADRLHPEWHDRHVGDLVLLARRDLFGGYFADVAQTRIAGMERDRWIAYIPCRFVLQPLDAKTTRLLIREPLPSSWSDRWLSSFTWDPMHFVMEVRMLRGIKERAQGVPVVSPVLAVAGRIGWLLCALAVIIFFVRQHDRLPFLVFPLVWAVPVMLFTADWEAAIAAFLLVGITIGGALILGTKWWIAYPLVVVAALFILILAPDPFAFLGIVLGGSTLLSQAIVV